MRYSTAAFLGLLAVQQAAACDTCEWGQALGLPSCQSACNQCTQQQQQGLDFSQCPAGATSFGGLNLGGCSIGSWMGLKKRQSFIPRGGKRNLGDIAGLLGGGGGGGSSGGSSGGASDQCALGALTSGGGPSFSCGQDNQPFSISSMQMSCDHDTPVQLTYSYNSGPQAGQTCQQTAQLTAGGPNTITNTQCGGAHSVQCALGPSPPVPSCNVGIHNINFDCSGCNGGTPGSPSPPSAPSQPAAPPPPSAPSQPAAPPPPSAPSQPAAPPPPSAPSQPAAPPPPSAPSQPAAPPPVPPPSTPSQPAAPPPVPPPTTPSQPAAPPPGTPSVPAVPPPVVPPPVVPPPGSSTTGIPTVVSITSSPSLSMPTYPANGSTVVIQSTQTGLTTEIVYTTITSCSGVTTHTQGNYTSIETVPTLSTIEVTSTAVVCTSCQSHATSAPSIIATTISASNSVVTQSVASNSVQSVVVTQGVASSSPVQPAPAPSLLPSCLQTWIKLTGCKDNSDANCFCNDANFTKNVQECVSAWSNHKDQEAQALSYLAGICAQHIPNNPGIVTNIPSTITIQPTPVPSNSGQNAPVAPGGQTAAPSPPMTIVSISTTVTVQCPATYTALSGSAAVNAASMNSGCTTTSVLSTQVTVPQVAFTTAQPGKVGLVAGTPAPAQAVPTGVNSPQAPAAANPANSPAPAAPNSNANSPAVPAPAAPPAAAAPAGTGAITPYNKPSATVQSFVGAASNVRSSSSAFLSVVLVLAGFILL